MYRQRELFQEDKLHCLNFDEFPLRKARLCTRAQKSYHISALNLMLIKELHSAKDENKTSV